MLYSGLSAGIKVFLTYLLILHQLHQDPRRLIPVTIVSLHDCFTSDSADPLSSLKRTDMAPPISLALAGVRDQIAAAIADSLEQHQAKSEAPTASSIGEEVGNRVATVLENALHKIKKPAFDASSLREQILGEISCLVVSEDRKCTDTLTWLANADAILNLYDGAAKRHITGMMLTVTGTGEQTEAALVVKSDNPNFVFRNFGSLVVIQGPYKESDIDALLALHDYTKLALDRARSQAFKNARLYGCAYAFSDFATLRS